MRRYLAKKSVGAGTGKNWTERSSRAWNVPSDLQSFVGYLHDRSHGMGEGGLSVTPGAWGAA